MSYNNIFTTENFENLITTKEAYDQAKEKLSLQIRRLFANSEKDSITDIDSEAKIANQKADLLILNLTKQGYETSLSMAEPNSDFYQDVERKLLKVNSDIAQKEYYLNKSADPITVLSDQAELQRDIAHVDGLRNGMTTLEVFGASKGW